jgi:Protein of unknown function (DUF642)/PEP-CTERM motif
MGFYMKTILALSLLLVLAGATLTSASSVPVIENPNFNSSTPLIQILNPSNGLYSNDPDSWDQASTPVVPDWNFTTDYISAWSSTVNLSGIAGPDLTPGTGETQDYFHFTAPPDGASQFAFLSSGSSVGQLVTGFQSGDLYVLTFSAESNCNGVVPITVSFNGQQSSTEYPTVTSAYSNPQSGWETFSVNFVAGGLNEYINFSTVGSYDIDSTGPFVALSDPTLTSTPEPSSLFLFGTGLFGLVFVAFRMAKSPGQVLPNR